MYALKAGSGPAPADLEGPGWEEARAGQLRDHRRSEHHLQARAARCARSTCSWCSPIWRRPNSSPERLGRLGNVASDGRPILGLDARFVLDLVLEIDPQALVIPAHIWTPWFSVLGSKSGFDSLEECFED